MKFLMSFKKMNESNILTLDQFKNLYEDLLELYTEEEIRNIYNMYLEDPLQFNSDMIS